MSFLNFKQKFFKKNIYNSLVTILDFSQLLVKHPFTMGTRTQLNVVSGLSVGIPFDGGFSPQLVVSGHSVGIPFDGGI
jgi:hypothetical protein